MSEISTRHPSFLLRAVLALWLGLFAAVAPAQEIVGGETLDGASFSAPAHWVMGEPLPVSGENWTTNHGNRGSVIGVKYNQGAVVPSEPLDEMDDLWARIYADAQGNWSVELPYPEDAGWAAGETHRIHFLTGLLGDDDKVRNPVLTVTIVEAEAS